MLPGFRFESMASKLCMYLRTLMIMAPVLPTPQATEQLLVGWSAFASLDSSCDISVEWFRVLESARPVATFRPGDVTVVRLHEGSGAAAFWLPARMATRLRKKAMAPESANEEDRHEPAEAGDGSADESEGSGDEDADWSGAASEVFLCKKAASKLHKFGLHQASSPHDRDL